MSEHEEFSVEVDAAIEEYLDALSAQYSAKTRVNKAKQKIVKIAKQRKVWVLTKSDKSYRVDMTVHVDYPAFTGTRKGEPQ